MSGLNVRFAVLRPDRIFNLTSPRYLPEVARYWRGKRPWHDPFYEPLRDRMERAYIDEFNQACGHFDRLLDSVRRTGFRNPILVSAGGLQTRRSEEIPPHLDQSELMVSEYLGGSRLWAAEVLGIDIPCIVNDFGDVLQDAELLPNLAAVLAKFTDRPARAEVRADGSVYLNNLPFAHMPPDARYTMRQQIALRKRIIITIRADVRRWLREHDV